MADVELRIRTRVVGDSSRILQQDASAIDTLERKQTVTRRKESDKRIVNAREEATALTDTLRVGESRRTAVILDASERRGKIERKETGVAVDEVAKRQGVYERLYARLDQNEKQHTDTVEAETQKRHSIFDRFRTRFLSDERSFASAVKRVQSTMMSFGREGLEIGGRVGGRLVNNARQMTSLPALIGGGIMGVGVSAVMKGTIGPADQVQQAALITRMQLRGDEEAIARVQESIRQLSGDLGTIGATKGMQMGLRIANNDVGQATEITRLSAALAALDPSQGVDGALSTIEDLQFGRTRRLRRNFGLQIESKDAVERLAARGIVGEDAEGQIGTELFAMVTEELDRLYGGNEKGSGVSGLLAAAEQTVGGQLDAIKTEMGNIAISIGEPIVGTVVDSLQKLREQFDAFKSTPQFAQMIERASKLVGNAASGLIGVLAQLPDRIVRMYDMLNRPETRDSFRRLREDARRFFNLMKDVGERAFDLLPRAIDIATTALQGARPAIGIIGGVLDKLLDVAENPLVGKLVGAAGAAYVFDKASGGLLQETGGLASRGLAMAGGLLRGRKGAVGAAGSVLASASATPVYVTNWDGMSTGSLVKGVRNGSLVKGAGNLVKYGRGALAAAKGVAGATTAAGLAATTGVGLAYGGVVLGGLHMLGRAGNPTEKDIARMKKRGATFLEKNQAENMSERQIKKRVAYFQRIGAHDQADKLLQKTERTVNAPVQITPTVHISGAPSSAQLEELSAYFKGPFQNIFAQTIRNVLDDEARRNGV